MKKTHIFTILKIYKINNNSFYQAFAIKSVEELMKIIDTNLSHKIIKIFIKKTKISKILTI